MIRISYKALVFSILLLMAASGIGSAFAFGTDGAPASNLRHQDQRQLDSILTPLLRSQNQQVTYRSRSDVMREVKRRYDAKVLKISLNRQREIYNVRLLMPNGKVRSIQVSARR